MKKTIANRGDDIGILFHVYVRNSNGVSQLLDESASISSVTRNSVTEQRVTQSNEDYMDTLEKAYKNVLIEKKRNGYKSLNFLNKIFLISKKNISTYLMW